MSEQTGGLRAPLSANRLNEIRALAILAHDNSIGQVALNDLLGEVDRLQAREAALAQEKRHVLAILETIMSFADAFGWKGSGFDQARALLAAQKDE